jgi:hypothetical protein
VPEEPDQVIRSEVDGRQYKAVFGTVEVVHHLLTPTWPHACPLGIKIKAKEVIQVRKDQDSKCARIELHDSKDGERSAVLAG